MQRGYSVCVKRVVVISQYLSKLYLICLNASKFVVIKTVYFVHNCRIWELWYLVKWSLENLLREIHCFWCPTRWWINFIIKNFPQKCFTFCAKFVKVWENSKKRCWNTWLLLLFSQHVFCSPNFHLICTYFNALQHFAVYSFYN